MNSRVHPKYKTRYRVSNWVDYDRALVQRGDITLWISESAIASCVQPMGGSTVSGERTEKKPLDSIIAEADPMPSESAVAPVGNRPPRFTGVQVNPGRRIESGQDVSVIAHAVDPDGDSDFRYRLVESPDGMAISQLGGLVMWTPSVGQQGVFPIAIEIEDAGGATATQKFELRLEDSAQPPASGG